MMMATVKFLLVVLFALHANAADWAYSGTSGPGNWDKLHIDSNECGLRQQSPIDIEPYTTKYDKSLQNFKITNSDKGHSLIFVKNNGHTFQLGVNGSSTFDQMIQGGPLGKKYKLLQIHFHWGRDSYRGSEHTVNGKRYPIEMHMVHIDEGYKEGEKMKADTLAVVGVFFDVTNGNGNAGMQSIANMVTELGTNAEIGGNKQWAPASVLPDTSEYFTYKGSLTTPPCSQVVTWIVLKEPLKITEEQLAPFRALKDSHDNVIEDNFRPTLALNNREVRSSFMAGSSSTLCASLLLISVQLIFLRFASGGQKSL